MFNQISLKAGIGTIPAPFRNMRRSRSNEVEREYGSAKENLWIGHSMDIMQRHYFRLSDEDYAQAAGVMPELQKPHAESHAEHDAVGV